MEMQEIFTVAEKMMRDDQDRDIAFEAYDSIYHNGWDLPDEVKLLPWIRKVISSDPHDAINAGDRVLSTIPLSIRFQPLAPGDENKLRANQIEKILAWQLKGANRRRSTTVESDVVRSALLYMGIAAQVIDLDHQIKQKEFYSASAKREKAARRYGRFVVKTYNPRSVHVRYSGLMPEAVLLCQKKDAQEVIDEWGDLARDIPGLVEIAMDPESSAHDVWYYDYWDYETRAVWCTSAAGTTVNISSEAMVILDAVENDLPFMPWVCLMGGSTLETESMHKYQPMFYAIYTSGAWETQNILETLMASEVIARTGSPRYVDEGPNPREADIDFDDPARVAKPAPGNILRELRPPEADRALEGIHAMFAAKLDKSMVSRILQGGEIPPGVAFATLNLATQTAVGVLKPAKDLAQKALAEVLTLMLLWVEHSGITLTAMVSDAENKDIEEAYIAADEIDPLAIYLETELHPDTPTDRQQKINAAAMAVRELNMPLEMALEEIGVNDPQGAIRARLKERLLEHTLDMIMQEDLMRMQAQVQMEMAQRQAEMQMQMQGAMQGQTGPPQGPEMMAAAEGEQEQMLRRRQGSMVPGGQGFNPAEEGMPPQTANPGAIREFISGEDFLGNEVMV